MARRRPRRRPRRRGCQVGGSRLRLCSRRRGWLRLTASTSR